VGRGGTLQDANHRLLEVWAADCTQHVLHLFEQMQPTTRSLSNIGLPIPDRPGAVPSPPKNLSTVSCNFFSPSASSRCATSASSPIPTARACTPCATGSCSCIQTTTPLTITSNLLQPAPARLLLAPSVVSLCDSCYPFSPSTDSGHSPPDVVHLDCSVSPTLPPGYCSSSQHPCSGFPPDENPNEILLHTPSQV
jgi:hypothetical protein